MKKCLKPHENRNGLVGFFVDISELITKAFVIKKGSKVIGYFSREGFFIPEDGKQHHANEREMKVNYSKAKNNLE